jgi:hypothetical protein
VQSSVIDDGAKQSNVGINVGIKQGCLLSHTEENAVKAILQDNRITAKALSVALGVTLRQSHNGVAQKEDKPSS